MKPSSKLFVTAVVVAGLGMLAGGDRERRHWIRAGDEWAARRAGIAPRAAAPDDDPGRLAAEIAGEERRLAVLGAELGLLESRAKARAKDPARWNAPPADWPAWEPDSPYVWLTRDLLPSLPLASAAFGPDGSLATGAAQMLGLGDDGALGDLDRRLAALVDAMHESERAHTRLVGPAPSGSTRRAGDQLTIRIDPDPALAETLRARFLGELEEALGPARAAVLREAAESWAAHAFSPLEGEGRTISVAWNADGTQTVSVRSPWQSQSATGTNIAGAFVPPHLLPLLRGAGDP